MRHSGEQMLFFVTRFVGSESLSRFGPPVCQDRTPTPGLAVVLRLLSGAVQSCRGYRSCRWPLALPLALPLLCPAGAVDPAVGPAVLLSVLPLAHQSGPLFFFPVLLDRPGPLSCAA